MQENTRLALLRDVPQDSLMIHEIYASIQGESSHAGLPCTFVRTSACHLRCRYCDTPHAFHAGQSMTLEAIEKAVEALGHPLVEITGGEPLLQENIHRLMTRLCDRGHQVLLETSGSLDISAVDPRVMRIVDMKTPFSGEEGANLYENLQVLRADDELKFVIADRQDYEWARALLQRHRLSASAKVLMGTVHGAMPDADLVQWILEDGLDVRFQLQVHKIIWDPKRRGV
ncbi:MAG: radical SAM protein [Myxococcota bacterium]|nr:radical SAM protein [Myxococcota bacterium]